MIRKEIKNSQAENRYEQELSTDSVEKEATAQKEFEELLDQEQEVLLLYSKGYTQDEIGKRVNLTHGRISQILSDIKTRLTKSSPTLVNKPGKENGKTKSETSDDERYAFDDFLHSNKTREEAEHEHHKGKPKPTYSAEYDPDESKIDFVGLKWDEFLRSKGVRMSVDPYHHYRALLWQAGYDWKNLNGPSKEAIKDKTKYDKKYKDKSDRVAIGDKFIIDNEVYTLVSPFDVNLEGNEISVKSPIGNAVWGGKEGERVSVDVPEGHKELKVELYNDNNN